jgi:Tol biopolymer transport system component
MIRTIGCYMDIEAGRSSGRRHAWIASLSVLSVLAIPLWGCGTASVGRWDRYAGGGSFIGARPSMSPDGRKVAYSSPETGHGDIYRIDADGSNKTRLTFDEEYEGSPAFSFAGERLCYMREERGIGHIWLMDASGGHQVQVTKGAACDEDPSFSHDGLRIVFCRRFRDDVTRDFLPHSSELFVAAVDGSSEERLTNDSAVDSAPSFAPDDKSILFVSNDKACLLDLTDRIKREVVAGWSPNVSVREPSKLVHVGGTHAREIHLYDLASGSDVLVHKSNRYHSSPTFCRDGLCILYMEEHSAGGTGIIWIQNLQTGDRSIVVDSSR